MCGIAGVALGSGGSRTDLAYRVQAMADGLLHRGPDDGGLYESVDRRVALGTRRLAIQDLSPAGHMPMANAAETVWITYNGELYNAAELRADLETLGYTFRSHGDTEVVLYGYEAWGVELLDRLRGMFSLAIYDRRMTPRLLLARDPLGIKPLYYAWVDGALVFASECRAVVSSGLVSREIGQPGLLAYLQLGSVPAPLTIYRDIRALEAGHYLMMTWTGAAVRPAEPVPYWGLPADSSAAAAEVPYPDAVERVRGLLLDSVRRHLVSDVPLGVFLSGGVDSGSLVALMRAADPSGTIRSCSVVFDEQRYDESIYAHEVARHFATDHHDVRVTAADLGNELEPILDALDQPSNDGVNTYFVSRAARQVQLTVALSGLGGDELFGGYPTFSRLGPLVRRARLLQALPGALPALAAGLGAWHPHHPGARLAGWVRRGGAEPAATYLGLRGMFSAATLRDLVRPEVLHDGAAGFDLLNLVRRSAALPRSTTTHDQASRLELTAYMRHQLLRDGDVMSMAHSLEIRVPFVDRVVVENILALNTTLPPGALPKQLLRDAVPTLPAAVRLRQDKQGFSFPFGPWLGGPLRPQFGELVREAAEQFRPYLRPDACARVLAAFDAGRTHWSRPWALAALTTATRTSPRHVAASPGVLQAR
jgi:asparagine synthase (glutamine-hydrolysing)